MERLDRDFVKRDEFQALAEEALQLVVLRRNERKISGFSAAVAHSATIERPDQRMRERFLDWLDQLRPVHLEISVRGRRDGLGAALRRDHGWPDGGVESATPWTASVLIHWTRGT